MWRRGDFSDLVKVKSKYLKVRPSDYANFELKIRRRPDNLTSISKNIHLRHHFSVFFEKAANSGSLTSRATLLDLSWNDRQLLSGDFWFLPPIDFAVITVSSWRCCIVKFFCSKLYFAIPFLSIFLLSPLPFLTKCEYAPDSKYNYFLTLFLRKCLHTLMEKRKR